jgi:hypothetical protein
VPFENVVFRSTDSRVLAEALLAGAGIGFMGTREAGVHPELVEVMGPPPDWTRAAVAGDPCRSAPHRQGAGLSGASEGLCRAKVVAR